MSTLAQNPKSPKRKKRDRSTGRHEANQFELFDTAPAKAGRGSGRAKKEPATPALPEHPLVVTPESTAYYWRRNRYRFSCAYSGLEMGFPCFGHEVEKILSRFKGRRSPVSIADFWEVAAVVVSEGVVA